MTPADAVRDALAPLALAGYDPTPSGLVQALADHGEALSLLAQWQADGETVAVMQGARAHLDAARARRSRPPPALPGWSPVHGIAGFHRATASDARCPWCGAGVKWSCDIGLGMAHCQDGWLVSRRLPGDGEACGWPGARVVRRGDDVVPDETDQRWSALRPPTDPPPPVARRNCWTCRHASENTARCAAIVSSEDVADWVLHTHRGADRCPPDADGCPGWQPTDPPPSADYVGPGWADGVPRG